ALLAGHHAHHDLCYQQRINAPDQNLGSGVIAAHYDGWHIARGELLPPCRQRSISSGKPTQRQNSTGVSLARLQRTCENIFAGSTRVSTLHRVASLRSI